MVADFRDVPARVAEQGARRKFSWFAEQFIDGREITVALIDGPQVLPIPEIEFVDCPTDKPRIVGYAAKWQEDSFECRNTVRRFVDPVKEAALCAELARVSLRCRDIFQLRGYARVGGVARVNPRGGALPEQLFSPSPKSAVSPSEWSRC